MRTYEVIGFKHGVWCKITIRTTPECIKMRANEKGVTEITYIKEVA